MLITFIHMYNKRTDNWLANAIELCTEAVCTNSYTRHINNTKRHDVPSFCPSVVLVRCAIYIISWERSIVICARGLANIEENKKQLAVCGIPDNFLLRKSVTTDSERLNRRSWQSSTVKVNRALWWYVGAFTEAESARITEELYLKVKYTFGF